MPTLRENHEPEFERDGQVGFRGTYSVATGDEPNYLSIPDALTVSSCPPAFRLLDPGLCGEAHHSGGRY